MKKIRLILGDQLSHSISSLEGYDKLNDIILICEVIEEASYVKHHKKKIAFLFSAMRHFANELTELGYTVSYVKLDDELNTGSFLGEIKRFIADEPCGQVVVTQPGEYRLLKDIRSWESELGVAIEVRADNRFLSTPEEFSSWASERKQIRME